MRACGWPAGLGIVMVGATLAAQDPGLVFRSAVDSVVVNVSVTERGRGVGNLTRAEFELRDNGILQSVSEVTRESLPIDITLVVDLSGSVTGPLLASLQRALASLRPHLQPTDRASIVAFNHHLREIPMPTGDAPISADALGATGGQTSLRDAIAAAIMVPPDPERRQMAIVFTDGRDSTSFLDEPAVIAAAARSDVAVFTVTLNEAPAGVPTAAPNEEFFKALTETTGGERTTIRSQEDLAGSFVRALEAFRTSYVLKYTLANQTRPGWHDLSVHVTRRGQYDVRARKGYFGAEAGQK